MCDMKYIICTDREGIIKILESFPAEEAAIKRLKYHYKKEKCPLRIIPIPEMKVGAKIYKSDGQYLGKVVYETCSLWGISRSEDETMPDPYGKQRMEQLIAGCGLVVVDGVEVSDINEMSKKISDIECKTLQVLKNLEYIGAEQVTFFKNTNK